MPIPFYRCERCNREYPVEGETKACENSHLPVVSVRSKQYSIRQHPFMREVTFDDGFVKDYTADHLHGGGYAK